MNRDFTTLERNLTLLFTRAYQPVRAAESFRRQTGERFVDSVAERAHERRRVREARELGRAGDQARVGPRLSRPQLGRPHMRLVRWSLVAAAALLAVFLTRDLDWRGAREPASLESILASGAVASRTAGDGPWAATTGAEIVELAFDGEFLELATPAALPAQVQVGAHSPSAPDTGELWNVFPASRVVLERASSGVEASLSSGGLIARRATSTDALRKVRTSQGSLQLDGSFDVRVALEGPEHSESFETCVCPPSTWTRVSIRRGSAQVAGRGGAPLALAAGEEAYLCEGAVVSALGAGASERPSRTEVEGQSAAAATSSSPARKPWVRGTLTSAGAPLEHFEIVALANVQLPQVAEPRSFVFEGAAGAFELFGPEPGREGLPEGPVTLFAKVPGLAITRIEAEVSAAGTPLELRIELHPGARLEGLVVDAENGRPIADAYVVSESDSQLSVLSIDPDENGPFAHATRTRAGGDFALEELSRGSHSIRASAAGYGQAWFELRDLTAGEVRAGIRLELRRPGAIAGVVLDGDSKPVAGALVLASTTDFERKRPSLTYAEAKTDAEGRYRLDDLGAGAWAVLNFGARPGALAPEYQFVQVVAGTTATLDFRPLSSSHVLVGRLLDTKRAPVVGRNVMVGARDSLSAAPDGRWASTTTDANGVFRALGLAPGAHEVYVSGATPAEMMWVGQVEVSDAPVTEHELVLGGGSLSGRVMDGERAQPMGFAVVVVIRRDAADRGDGDERFQGRVFTAADGTYRIEHLEPGAYDVFVYATRGEFGQEQSLNLVSDGARPLSGVDFTLFAGGRLAVRVADESDRPLAAQLDFYDERGVRVQFSERDATSDTGRYNVRGIKPGRWTVRARAEGFAGGEATARVLPGERADAEIVLRKP